MALREGLLTLPSPETRRGPCRWGGSGWPSVAAGMRGQQSLDPGLPVSGGLPEFRETENFSLTPRLVGFG